MTFIDKTRVTPPSAQDADTSPASPGLSHVAISVVSTEAPSTSLGVNSVPSGETFSPR
jgi:hypothetical protein